MPFILGVITLSFLIHFWWLLVFQMLQEEGFKFCWETRSNGACPEHLSVQSAANLPKNQKKPPNQTKIIKMKKFKKW
jgi:hypothetical protein